MPTILKNSRKGERSKNAEAATAVKANVNHLQIQTPVITPVPVTAEVVAVPVAEKVNDLEFTVYQADISFKINTPVKDTSAQQVIGNVVNALYRWVALQRAFKAKGLKFSKPLGIRFSVGGNLWDTGYMDMTFTERLKLQDTPHGRVSFAQKLYALYLHSTYTPEAVTYDAYMSVLRAAVPPPVKRVAAAEKAA